MDFAKVRWTGKRQFVGVDGAGHSVVMDAKPEYKGENSGIRPIEMVLHGLAACTAMDVISILEKKRQDVRGLELNVTATQREDEFPKIYDHITIEYVVTGYNIQPDAVARAIELSEEKYCSVRGMLGPQVELVWTYRIEESREAGRPELAGEPVSE